MREIVGNLHMHTTTSDGHGTHDEVADAAIQAGLDFIIVTDHNTMPLEFEGYYYRGFQRILRLIGEEVHDIKRIPERSHLLIYGGNEDLSRFSNNPQTLIREARKHGALSFLAHPQDCEVPLFNQPHLSWDDWDVDGYTGIEIWNYMTSFKFLIRSRAHAVFYGLFPSRIRRGPERELMERWDRMLADGKRVVAIGSADAHALPFQLGPIRRAIFPYAWLFKAVNTHVLLDEPLSGEASEDGRRLIEAIGRGNCFVGYDQPANTRGFMFIAHSEYGKAIMGDRLRYRLGATLQVSTPEPAQIRIIRAGQVLREWPAAQHGVHSIGEPGAYRVEACRSGTPWIYSNPIYVERG
ncbi:MAG: CehA/McbA family metallohydrolase [Anaerolineales bacterium]